MTTAIPTIRAYLLTWTGDDDYSPPVNAPFEFYHRNVVACEPGDELAIFLAHPHVRCVRMLLEALTPARQDRHDLLWYVQTRVLAVSDNGIPLADIGVVRCHQGGVDILKDAQRDDLHAHGNWSRWTDSSHDEWVDHATTLP